jgi:hypothetical protein
MLAGHSRGGEITTSRTADLAGSACHPVEYHEFPSCIGDLRDHQIRRDEAIVRSQQFFRPN